MRRFARQGYDKARLADIARDAGMTDAGLIHHFMTKHDLFMAVVERREEIYLPLSTMEPQTVAELFAGLVEGVRAAMGEPEYVRFRAMLSGASVIEDHPATAHLRRRLAEAVDYICDLVERGIASGELMPGREPRSIALQVLALNDGIRAQWALAPGEVDYAVEMERAVGELYATISGGKSMDAADRRSV